MKKILLSITTLILLTLNVEAANPKYVIQISTDNARTQKIALNNAANLQKYYGGKFITRYLLFAMSGLKPPIKRDFLFYCI
jgi:hypothetical protein